MGCKMTENNKEEMLSGMLKEFDDEIERRWPGTISFVDTAILDEHITKIIQRRVVRYYKLFHQSYKEQSYMLNLPMKKLWEIDAILSYLHKRYWLTESDINDVKRYVLKHMLE